MWKPFWWERDAVIPTHPICKPFRYYALRITTAYYDASISSRSTRSVIYVNFQLLILLLRSYAVPMRIEYCPIWWRMYGSENAINTAVIGPWIPRSFAEIHAAKLELTCQRFISLFDLRIPPISCNLMQLNALIIDIVSIKQFISFTAGWNIDLKLNWIGFISIWLV